MARNAEEEEDLRIGNSRGGCLTTTPRGRHGPKSVVYFLNLLDGLVVKASASRAEDPGFESRLRRDFFGVESYQGLYKLALQCLPCQAPGVIGSALGLVGPVSVYCDWVR